MIIGGRKIYQQMLIYTNKMLITKVNKAFKADVYFPEIDEKEWDVEVLKDYKYKDISYQRLRYQRKRF